MPNYDEQWLNRIDFFFIIISVNFYMVSAAILNFRTRTYIGSMLCEFVPDTMAIFEKLKNRSRLSKTKTAIYFWHSCHSWPISSFMSIT
jgi:hypothetical protein